MKKKLKPCPLCGRKGSLAYYTNSKYPEGEYVIECDGVNRDGIEHGAYCGFSVRGSQTLEKAIARWNRRTDYPELKVCPCCGGKARIAWRELPDDPDGVYWVECINPKCFAETVSSSNVEDVIKIWNRRNNDE